MATEKRLIEKTEAIMMLRGKCVGKYPSTFLMGLFAAADEIDKMPTVDAVEVVHGQWVNPYMNRFGHPCHCCSVCGFKASYQDKNYCPNCGAKMDGGADNG